MKLQVHRAASFTSRVVEIQGSRGRGRPGREFTNDVTELMRLGGVTAMGRQAEEGLKAKFGGGRRPPGVCANCLGYGEEEEEEI